QSGANLVATLSTGGESAGDVGAVLQDDRRLAQALARNLETEALLEGVPVVVVLAGSLLDLEGDDVRPGRERTGEDLASAIRALDRSRALEDGRAVHVHRDPREHSVGPGAV